MAHHNNETWSDRESEPEGGVSNDGIPESAESDNGQGSEDSVGSTVSPGSDDGNHYDLQGNPRNKGYSTDGSNDLRSEFHLPIMGRKKKSPGDLRTTHPLVSSVHRDKNHSTSHSSSTTCASTLTSSVVGHPPATTISPINTSSSDVGGALGAARLREANALAFAADATRVADAIESALLAFRAKHKKLLLMKAFGINPNGTAITDCSLVPATIPTYHSVKTVSQYNKMIDILSNWGDDEELAALPKDHPDYKRITSFCMKNVKHGYYYAKEFKLKTIQNCNGSEKKLLIQRKSDKIVSHMLKVYDAIWEAHARIGHLGHDKTVDACSETHYSPTQQLVKIFCQDCFICLEKQPRLQPH
jgi:hypothetical protein